MKTITIKQFFVFLGIISVLFSLNSCRQDDFDDEVVQTNQQKESPFIIIKGTVSEVDFYNKLTNSVQFAENKLKPQFILKSSNNNEKPIIHTEQVQYMEDEEGNHSYTFQLTNPNEQNDLVFYNLVMASKSDGKYEYYILTYSIYDNLNNLDNQLIDIKVLNNFSFDKFQAKTLSDSSDPCTVTEWVTYCHPADGSPAFEWPDYSGGCDGEIEHVKVVYIDAGCSGGGGSGGGYYAGGSSYNWGGESSGYDGESDSGYYGTGGGSTGTDWGGESSGGSSSQDSSNDSNNNTYQDPNLSGGGFTSPFQIDIPDGLDYLQSEMGNLLDREDNRFLQAYHHSFANKLGDYLEENNTEENKELIDLGIDYLQDLYISGTYGSQPIGGDPIPPNPEDLDKFNQLKFVPIDELIQEFKRAKLINEINEIFAENDTELIDLYNNEQNNDDYKNWIISQVSNNTELTTSYFNNEITKEQLYDNILDLYFEEIGVAQFQEMIDNEEVYFPQTVTDNHNLADIITDLIWANLANDFINNTSKEDVKNVILTALLSNALDKNKKIKKGLKSLLKFPNKIGKGKEISDLVNSGFKVLDLYEKAKGLLNVENSTSDDLYQIITSIGEQGNNPYIRKVNGTKDEANALFNRLRSASGQPFHYSQDGSAKWFILDNEHSIKIRPSGDDTVIDLIGPKFRPDSAGGNGNILNKAEIKFKNE